MYSQTQLDIIRVFGRKDLTEGCRIYRIYPTIPEKEFHPHPILIIVSVFKDYVLLNDMEWVKIECLNQINGYKILGHIPHLEDIQLWMNKNTNGFSQVSESDYNYIKPRNKPDRIQYDSYCTLLEQPESTLLELLKIFK